MVALHLLDLAHALVGEPVDATHSRARHKISKNSPSSADQLACPVHALVDEPSASTQSCPCHKITTVDTCRVSRAP